MTGPSSSDFVRILPDQFFGVMQVRAEESRHPFDAVVFDLDGVITDTDKVHATAWKEVFDPFLKQRGTKEG